MTIIYAWFRFIKSQNQREEIRRRLHSNEMEIKENIDTAMPSGVWHILTKDNRLDGWVNEAYCLAPFI